MIYPPSLSCMPPTKLGATAIVVIVGSSSQCSPDSHPWTLLVKSSSRSHRPEPNTLKPEHTLSLLTGLFPCPQLRKSYCLSKHFSASNIHPSSHQIPSTSHVSRLSPCSTGVLSASLSTSLQQRFDLRLQWHSGVGHYTFPLTTTKTTFSKHYEPVQSTPEV